MKFYEFGNPGDPVILLLPGACCLWRANFGEVIPMLMRSFHVICASYDGFDETERGLFPDIITETEKIEQYILEKFGGNIFCTYGCLLGGSIAGLLVQRGMIHIEHAIVGSSGLEQKNDNIITKLKAWLIGMILYKIFQTDGLPGVIAAFVERKPAEERKYYEKMLYMFGLSNTHMAFVNRKSIRDQYYYGLITPLGDSISAPGTDVHIFYAAKMGEKYTERYKKHFRSPDIRTQNMLREELLICCPEQWVQEIKECCKMTEASSKTAPEDEGL